MVQCHGCKGQGWVDSQYKGPTTCPICGGYGKVGNGGSVPVVISPKVPGGPKKPNANLLLAQLEVWLSQESEIVFGGSGKTMNTYNSYPRSSNRLLGLVWVVTNSNNMLYLRKGDYSKVDSRRAVLYADPPKRKLFGGYPQFQVETQDDLEYAKKLIKYALQNL